MKKSLGAALSVLAMSLSPPAWAEEAPPRAVVIPIGIAFIFDPKPDVGASVTIFAVAIGEPQFDPARRLLAMEPLIGPLQANAILYVRMQDDSWTSISWRMPASAKEFAAGLVGDLMVRAVADERSFPPWYHSLPEKERATISFFLAFYSGAYRIYAGDHTLSEARALALAINGETTALPEEEHGR